jgi:hypothetical protein
MIPYTPKVTVNGSDLTLQEEKFTLGVIKRVLHTYNGYHPCNQI